MSRWFRHYAGMMRDEKLVRVAVKSGQPVERVIWVWGAILESACEVNDGGRYDFDSDEAAYFLRCDGADVGAVLAALEGSGRLANGLVAKWSDRQFDSDTSRERQRRYRERRNADASLRESDAHPASGDGAVTSRDGEVTLQETDTDTRTREDTSSLRSDGAASAPSIEDPRTLLFRQGLSYLAILTGKPETKLRSMVGKWLRDCDDDALRVLTVISQAHRDKPAEPVSWIEARIRPHRNGHDPPPSGKVVQNIPVADEAYVARVRAERAAARN